MTTILREAPSRAAELTRVEPAAYYPALDGLRALAFLMVFLHHARYAIFQNPIYLRVATSLGAGLPVFFVLSSFLITELLLRERERFGTIHVKAFFVRRMLRIWPLYFAFVGGCYVFYRFHAPEMLTNKGLVCMLLLAGNVYIYTHNYALNVCGHLWSLSVEEQFYVLWPYLGKIGGRRGFAIASACISVVGAVALWHMRTIHAPRYMVWTNSFVQFQFFAVGAALALVLHARPVVLAMGYRAVLFAGAFVCFFEANERFHVVKEGPLAFHALLGGYGLLCVGCAMLLLSVYRMAVPGSMNWVLYLGRISYGMYVFHLLATRLVLHAFGWAGVRQLSIPSRWIHVAEAMLSLLLTIALAAFSYRFFESWFLRLKSRFEFVRTRVI